MPPLTQAAKSMHNTPLQKRIGIPLTHKGFECWLCRVHLTGNHVNNMHFDVYEVFVPGLLSCTYPTFLLLVLSQLEHAIIVVQL